MAYGVNLLSLAVKKASEDAIHLTSSLDFSLKNHAL